MYMCCSKLEELRKLHCRYQGPYLLDAIDSLKPPVRDVSKPFRMPICDVIKFHSSGQVAASGKLEAGAIRNGSKVQISFGACL